MKVEYIHDTWLNIDGETMQTALMPKCPACGAWPTYNEARCPACGVGLEYGEVEVDK